MEQLTTIRLLERYWWLIVVGLIGGLGSTALFISLRTPQYQAMATVVLGPSEKLATPADLLRSLESLTDRSVLATYAAIPTSLYVRNRAVEQLGLSDTAMKLYTVKASILPDTNIIRISVVGPDPNMAAAVCNAVAGQSQSYGVEFYAGVVGLKSLDPAVALPNSVSASLARVLTMGAILGLLGGVGLSFLTEFLLGLRETRARRT